MNKFILIAAIMPCFVSAAEITATSGNTSDIQAAVNQAQAGDTVIIPEGTWNATGQVFLQDGIHLKGNGRDKTRINKMYWAWEDTAPMFNVRCDGKGPGFKFSDITLHGDGASRFWSGERGNDLLDNGLLLNGKCIDFSIFQSRFEFFAGEGIFLRGPPLNIGPGVKIHGHPKGVIYKNEFLDNIYDSGFGYGIALAGDENDWTISLGSDNAVFIEDNYFYKNRHAIASNNASRYVFRHNVVTDNWNPWVAIDAHGLSSWPRGSRSFEIYGNTISGGIEWDTGISNPTWGIGPRGGDGVIFGNTFIGMQGREILMFNEKYETGTPYPQPDQTLDLWIWDNMSDGYLVTSVKLGWYEAMIAANSVYLQEGRDYYFAQKPGYTPFTYPHPLRATAKPKTCVTISNVTAK